VKQKVFGNQFGGEGGVEHLPLFVWQKIVYEPREVAGISSQKELSR
jgi:hypothetical protein